MTEKKEMTDGHFSNEKPVGQSTFKVVLGGHETTDQIVKHLKANGFRRVHEAITQKNFPIKPHEIKDVQIEIVDPGRPFTAEEGTVFLKSMGLLPPTEEHALRFAEQRGRMVATSNEKCLVFLHRHWEDNDGRRRMLFIHNIMDDNRRFGLIFADNGFGHDCLLAGVRPGK